MSDPWQTPGEIRDRLGDTYQPDSIYTDHNVEKRFHNLLEQLEASARETIIDRLGDEPIQSEDGRTDIVSAPPARARKLIYPVRDVTLVEYRRTGGDWRELDADRYRHTEYNIILRRGNRLHGTGERNELLDNAGRREWADFADELRVTYDRGFDPVPANLIEAQTAIIKRMLRNRRTEQGVSALDPEQMEAVNAAQAVLTDDIIERIDSVTMGGKVWSV